MVARRCFFLLFLISFTAGAQDRYFVTFRDKTGTPYSISNPSAFLSQRAINRRTRSAVAVTNDDLPVNPSYVSQVKGTGAKTFFTSRWMNGLMIETSDISSVNALTCVLKTERVAPNHRLIGGRSGNIKNKKATSSAEVTANQLSMLGIDKMHADGFHGEGIIIGILDAGFQGVNTATPFQTVFSEGRVMMTKDFVTNSGNVYQFDDHGTEVFSIIAATVQDVFTSGAYKASYLLFVTEDVPTEYRVEEYNWLFAAEKSDSAGADVIQSSLGYNTFDDASMDYTYSNLDGKTTVAAKAAGMARDRAIIVVVSAGNEGNGSWRYITTPADTEGILAVGAVNSAGSKSGFSSFGPSSDGRIKPDVSALGQGVSIIRPNGSIGADSGTSMSAPLVTSLVAGLLQAFPEITPASLINMIRLTATKGNTPDNNTGYGIPSYPAVKNYLNASRLSSSVLIYPNPVSTTLQLAFRELPSGPVQLTFFDVLGRVMSDGIADFDWQNNPIEIPVSGLAPGYYILKVQSPGLQTTFRFVKL